jgi:redox-sensitive bicupin YhaK (pirin superfamily)
MSKRSEPVSAEACVALAAGERRLDAYPNRDLNLGSLQVSRALPIRERRLVGPWCFLDRFGPLTFTDGKPMDVAPHPHIGLQTVTWLHAGEIVHDDSLGVESVLRPGGVNIMTTGRGLAHAEQTPPDHTGRLDGVQLWTALPEAHRTATPGFAHVSEVPAVEWPSGVVQVFAGTIDTATAPGPYYSAIVGADLRVHAGRALEVPVDRTHEHALLVMSGRSALDGQPLEERMLYYLGTDRDTICVSSDHGARVLLVGGQPFAESILMWWNFVARTPEEIAEAREDWESHRRFGDVRAYNGPRLAAPRLTQLARPTPVS